MRPNFKNIDIKNAGFAATNAAEWAKANGIEPNWKTPEHIEVKPVYTKEDLEGMEHLNYASGLPPYLRGRTAVCTLCVLGQSVSTQVSLPLRSLTLSIAVTWLPVRKVCPLRSTFRLTVVTMPTTNVWLVM